LQARRPATGAAVQAARLDGSNQRWEGLLRQGELASTFLSGPIADDAVFRISLSGGKDKHFNPKTGALSDLPAAPCAIDWFSGDAIPGKNPATCKGASAASALQSHPIPGCRAEGSRYCP
jgi:hypothetical protein